LRFASGDEELRAELYERFGESHFTDFASVQSELENLFREWSNEDDEEEEGNDALAKKGLPEKKKRKLLDPKSWERDGKLAQAANVLRTDLGDVVFEDHNIFRDRVDATLDARGLKLSVGDKKLILRAVSWRVENAPPVIAKVHKSGKTQSDPLYGVYEADVDGKKCVIEYEPDTDLRDTERVPLLEPGGIEAFIRREVLPYATDAWVDQNKTEIGYEVSFTRHFYKPQPLRTLEEIRTDILALEKETKGLLSEILTGGSQP
jgi:type I restriction enzyme M protein